MDETKQSTRRRSLVTLVLAVLILVPSMLGFGAKFVEFSKTFSGDADGVFAITPMVNYLLASSGFFFLLIWATFNGMFRDIEKPKQDMLDREALLDSQTL